MDFKLNNNKNLYNTMMEYDSLSEAEKYKYAIDAFAQISKDLKVHCIVITPEEVRTLNINNLYRYFKKEAKRPIDKSYLNTMIVFHGYDDDPRELKDIPEVKAYIKAVVKKIPYCLFFLSKEYESYTVFLLSLFEHETYTTEPKNVKLVDRLRENKDRLDEMTTDELFPRMASKVHPDDFMNTIIKEIRKFGLEKGDFSLTEEFIRELPPF